MKEQLILKNEREELNRLTTWVEELAERNGWPLPLSMNLQLVLEEAVSNVIFYGFQNSKREELITVTIITKDQLLTITIEDKGIEFDPTENELPDLTLSASDRPVGGLGIFLIRKIMDQVVYVREGDTNRLILTKTIPV